jgi:hypothetical protein
MSSPKHSILNDVDLLIEKHKNDKFFISKLREYIKNSEKYIENTKNICDIRINRKFELQNEKKKFIERFLNKNNIQYLSHSDLFIYYDYFNFLQLDESKIWSDIYSCVSKNKKLIPWKQKIRIQIISQIKKNGINFNIIPESYTIQKILEIFQSVCCETKDSSKYLLTHIGDSILRKTNDKVVLINREFVYFLQELERKLNKFIKCNFLSNFKVKYHGHDYQKTNVLKNNNNVTKEYLWNNLIKDNIFNIIFVSIHYSNRFKNSNHFIENISICEKTKNDILYLNNNSKENIICDFKNKFLQDAKELKNKNSLSITKNEILYLFNLYLKEQKLPKIMFHNDVLCELEKYYKYNNEKYIFYNLTCSKLEYINSFLEFIKNQCSFKYENNINLNKNIYNYEVSELLQIYNDYSKKQISEKKILDIIRFFYNDDIKNENLFIENDKYIKGIFCKLWNKKEDLKNFYFDCIKNEAQETYTNYNKWCNKNNKKYIVSKSYFSNVMKLLSNE